MIRIIRGHNRLNGVRFSTAEFGAVGLIVLALAVYCLFARSYLVAIVSIGIAANCIPVVGLGIGSLRDGEPDVGLRGMLSPEYRAKALREYPAGQRDTYILAGATLLPFVVAIAVALELLARRRYR